MTKANFLLGERVIDTDASADESKEAVVVDLPDQTAGECYIGALDATVADVNRDHPADDPVVTIAFVDALNASASGWDTVPPEDLADELALIDEITLYTYPASRLALAEDS